MRARSTASRFIVLMLAVTPALVPITAGASTRIRPRADELVRLQTTTGTLEGTLTVPATPGPWPVTLLVPGAGHVDRDGNSATQAEKAETFALLAAGLAERGIATLRYDKRGVGASAEAGRRDSTAGFVTLAQDAALWVRHLQLDARFSSVTVIGHGEGALIGILATRTADADGFVSLAGHGRRGAEVMREQFTPRLPIELRAVFRALIDSLAAGRVADDVPYELASLVGRTAQLYLASWFRFDPAVEIGRLEVPVLIVQGSSDTQASLRDAQLLNAGLPRADAILIDRVDHALRFASAEPGSSEVRSARYARRARQPLAEPVLDGVASFVAQVKRR